MQSNRLIQPGHVLALVFVVLLLVGGRGFLIAHPVVAGLLLAAFAPFYLLAARITGYPQFLYPAVLLAVLAYHLLLVGAGLPSAHHPLFSLLPVALLYGAALTGIPRGIGGASATLYGANLLLIGVFAAWVLLRASWFFQQSPVSTAVALAGYAAYSWGRFLQTQKVAYTSATALLGSGAFLYLLYNHSRAALLVAVASLLWFTGELSYRKALPRLEALALVFVSGYLLSVALSGARAEQLPLGYLALGMAWLQLGVYRYRLRPPSVSGPPPAELPRLLPLFAFGALMCLLPVVLFHPWKPLTLAMNFLAIFFAVFLVAARDLGRYTLSLVGVGLTRVLSAFGRLAPVAALVYLAAQRFPPGYQLALAACGIGLLSLLAGWRQVPRVLVRRNIYVYQAGAFFSIAYFLAERQMRPAGPLTTLLDSGALLVLGLLGVGYALRERLAQPYVRSLFDVASVPATIACVLHVLRGPIGFGPALPLGGLLMLAGAIALLKVRRPAALFTWPVVFGLWLYVAEWLAGARSEVLGMPYLVWGILAAGIGYELLRRGNRWYELFYFMWFLCVGVSLTLFYPYRGVGAYAAPLWPLVFLLVTRATATRRDFPFALVLELLSGLLAVASASVLIYQHLYLPAAVALFLYALAYAAVGVTRQLWFYLHPAAVCAVAAYFLAILHSVGSRVFLPCFLPVAAVFYALVALLRRRGYQQQARPFELATSAGVALGALLFVLFPFGANVTLGWVSGLAYLVLYLLLAREVSEQGYLAGAGLAGAFAYYQLLPLIPRVTPANRLGAFIPAAFLLALLGWWRSSPRLGARDARGGWALFSASIAATATASLFALWPRPASLTTSRGVLIVALAVWLALLAWTRREIFIYCATLALAMLAYNFVQSSTDVFGQHLVAFFLWGTALLGLVFAGAAARNLVRFRRPLLFVPPRRWHQKALYLVPVGILGLATFASWGVHTSSNPNFCGACHDMNAYFANWKTSAHARAEVGCAACHYEPGVRGFLKAKLQGTSQLVATLTQTQGYKPVAHIGNETCLSSGCHSVPELSRRRVGGIYTFHHAVHLGTMARGPELRCTSCHTGVGPETHMGVDTNACFTCHFRTASAPRPASAVGCVACHGLPQGARGKSRFDHAAAGVQADDSSCMACHAEVTRGTNAVEQRQCRHCHLQRADALLAAGSAAIHKRHVSGKGIGCDWCHGVVKHGSS